MTSKLTKWYMDEINPTFFSQIDFQNIDVCIPKLDKTIPYPHDMSYTISVFIVFRPKVSEYTLQNSSEILRVFIT